MNFCVDFRAIFDRRLHNKLFGFAEIYAKVGQNSILQAKPSVVHFNGFQVGEKITKTLVSVMSYFNASKCTCNS